MRIVAGYARGLRLAGPGKEIGARPTSDKVREALFNMVNTRGMTVLDLFAGSGAVGGEALSRGAKSVVFVEKHKAAVKLIQKNIERIIGMIKASAPNSALPSVEFVSTEAVKYIEKDCGESFDFIFCDPPYAFEDSPILIKKIMGGNFLNPGGLLLFETSKLRVDDMPVPDRIKRYGDTVLLFYRQAGEDGADASSDNGNGQAVE